RCQVFAVGLRADFQAVTDAGIGADLDGPVGHAAELAPDMGDVRLQERAVRLAVHAPDEINEPSRRNDTIFVRGQAVEQAQLPLGQGDGTAFQQHAERVRVDGEEPADKAGRYDVHGVARGTSLDGPETHHEVL